MLHSKKITINMKAGITIILSLLTVIGWSQDRILIKGGFLHVGNGITMESAAVGVEEGRVTFVRNSLGYTIDPADWDTIIDVTGQHIYPGFVAPNSTLGITEIDAVRATRDYRDVGTYNPHVRSQIAFNVESDVVSTVKSNGVLICQPTPRGGIVSGTSSVMKMAGWNWEDATISKDDGIHLNWPSSMQGGGWWAEPADRKQNEKYGENLKEIEEFFDMATAYLESDDSEFDQRLEAMRGIFKGDKRVYIHADELQELTDVIDFAKEYKLKFPVIVGGYDSHLLTSELKAAKIPVMLLRTHSLPENEEDDIDHPFQLAVNLKEGGVQFCLQNEGDMEAMNARNIPFLAGTAMAYGLSEEDAISSISLWSCQIMGIDKDYGSVQRGKSATFFVSQGSALDMRSNHVTTALVDGELVSVDNFQTELYEKYKSKYEEEESK